MYTRRFYTLLAGLMLVMTVLAAGKDLKRDVTMLSYRQAWSDRTGVLTLRNNTDVTIRYITFEMTYLDMSGKELEDKDMLRYINAKPGDTVQVEIPAYGYRRYRYYQDKDDNGTRPAFKVSFELDNYWVEDEALDEAAVLDDDGEYDDGAAGVVRSATDDVLDDFDGEDGDGDDGFHGGVLLAVLIVALFVGLCITAGLYVLVAVMAQRRGRSVVAWLLVSLLATPVLVIIILLVIGGDKDGVHPDSSEYIK